jgi:hypothetical protein
MITTTIGGERGHTQHDWRSCRSDGRLGRVLHMLKAKKCTHGITLSIEVKFRDTTAMMYCCIKENERLGIKPSASESRTHFPGVVGMYGIKKLFGKTVLLPLSVVSHSLA